MVAVVLGGKFIIGVVEARMPKRSWAETVEAWSSASRACVMEVPPSSRRRQSCKAFHGHALTGARWRKADRRNRFRRIRVGRKEKSFLGCVLSACWTSRTKSYLEWLRRRRVLRAAAVRQTTDSNRERQS